jgi:hypothetical protein
MTARLIKAADDLVWEGEDNAYSAARRLMYAAMQHTILPFHVHNTRRWALGKAAEHKLYAEGIAGILKSVPDNPGVARLRAHHERISLRYEAVARAMQD